MTIPYIPVAENAVCLNTADPVVGLVRDTANLVEEAVPAAPPPRTTPQVQTSAIVLELSFKFSSEVNVRVAVPAFLIISPVRAALEIVGLTQSVAVTLSAIPSVADPLLSVPAVTPAGLSFKAFPTLSVTVPTSLTTGLEL